MTKKEARAERKAVQKSEGLICISCGRTIALGLDNLMGADKNGMLEFKIRIALNAAAGLLRRAKLNEREAVKMLRREIVDERKSGAVSRRGIPS